MEYTEYVIDHEAIHNEILAYLRQYRYDYVRHGSRRDEYGAYGRYLQAPHHSIHTQDWINNRDKDGATVRQFVDDIFDRLTTVGILMRLAKSAANNSIQQTQQIYSDFRLRTSIIEEVQHLFRLGIITLAVFQGGNGKYYLGLDSPNPNLPDPRRILLTEYGVKYLESAVALPYFAEEYLERLRPYGEVDEELQGYLSEGLACLRNNLPRAAAILLRVAVQCVLELIVDAVAQNMPDQIPNIESRRNNKNNIHQQIDAYVFEVPRMNSTQKNELQLLKSMMHIVVKLGADAAHPSNITISMGSVRDQYTAFERGIYAVAMRYVDYLHQQKGV